MSRKPPPSGRRARSQPRIESSPAPLPAARPVGRGKPLDTPETDELWRGYLAARRRPGPAGPELEGWRNALIERHLPLVRFVAERLARTLPRSVELEDLVSAGTFGLMDAIRGFDPARAVRFKTYAVARVRGAILDALRSDDWVPRLVRLRAAQLERALARLGARFGREPTHAELAAELDIEPADVPGELARARPCVQHRLPELTREGSADCEHEQGLPDPRSRTPLEQLIRRDALRALWGSLTHKERFLLEQYYEVGHTMREIGETLGLTESRVCQIHSNILARLRSRCERLRRGEGG
jgi:RNA polymerase sigma factor for flagellar operon FliA